MATPPRLCRIVLAVRDLQKSAAFFGPKGLGITIQASGEEWAVLNAGM